MAVDTHRWPRATPNDLRWGPLCDCGNLKTDQALTRCEHDARLGDPRWYFGNPETVAQS